MNAKCSRPDLDLTAYALGELEGAARREAADHLERCAACRSEYDALARLVDSARGLSRIVPTAAFHDALLARVRREANGPEGVAGSEGAAEGDVAMSLPDRIRLNAGLVVFSLRHSVIARSLLAAAAVLIAALLVISLLSRGQDDAAPIRAADERSQAHAVDDVEKSVRVKQDDLAVLLPEEEAARWPGLGTERLEAPAEDFPAPSAADGGAGALVALDVPADDIRERTARENTLELGRYRMFARFNPSCKKRVMEGRGGDAKTVYAVDRGLKWLRYHQEEDGSWDPEVYSGDTAHEFGGDPRTRVGLTALAVAAFLSDGNTETAGRYSDTVSSGVNYLLASRDRLGQFGKVEDSPAISLFNHSVAVLVLAENYILSEGRNEDELRLGAGRLVSLIHRIPSDAGHGTYGETWTAMALRTYLMTGLAGEEERLLTREVENRVALLARDEIAGGGLRPGGVPPLYSASIGAVGALFSEDEAWTLQGGLEEPEAPSDAVPFPDRKKPETLFALLDDPGLREPSFLFFITTALCEEPPAVWSEWNARVKGLLLADQNRDGFWPAGGDWPWIDGGDIYTTSLNILTLQVYYRFIKLEENCP